MKFDLKLKLLTVVSVLLVILIGVELHFIGKSDAHSAESSENSPAATQPEEEAPIAAEPEAEDPEPDAAAEGPTEPATEAPDETAAEPPEEEPDQSATEGQQEAPANTDPQGTAPSTPQQSQETPPSVPQEAEPAALKIPYSIPGTDLVIKQVNSYDGIFLEDGSDKEVTGISVIVLENQGKTGVEYANITLTQGGKTLEYQASAVPAGTTVVVQEAGAAAYSSADITACTADVAQLESFEMSSSFVKVQENEDGTLNVTNIGSETIPCVRIFYKFALEKDSIYVGGITYTAKLTQLEPGATQQVAPSHYTAGSSEIMMVRTYATAD